MRLGGEWLAGGGTLSAAAAALHIAAIAGGPAWYRAMGAGERVARAASHGRLVPAIATAAIAGVISLWAWYAFAGAGLVARPPLLRPGLVAICVLYLGRGLVLFRPSLLGRPDLSPAFLTWSSAVALAIGLVYAIGTWRVWYALNGDG